jgi:anti-sigma regulatory factor (Ser/Thr protein kinase)
MVTSLGEFVDSDSLIDVRQVVSELVGNSVAHGASQPIDLKFVLVDGEIEGVVDDHGPGTRALIQAKERRDTSLVLQIIDNLVNEWGASRTGVWFRLAVRRLGEHPAL